MLLRRLLLRCLLLLETPAVEVKEGQGGDQQDQDDEQNFRESTHPVEPP